MKKSLFYSFGIGLILPAALADPDKENICPDGEPFGMSFDYAYLQAVQKRTRRELHCVYHPEGSSEVKKIKEGVYAIDCVFPGKTMMEKSLCNKKSRKDCKVIKRGTQKACKPLGN